MNNNEKKLPAKGLLVIGRIGDVIENAFLVIGFIALLIFFFAVVFDVIARTVGNSVFWAQDTAIFSYFWCIFIAGAVCLRRNEHFSIELFQKMPKAMSFVKRLIVIIAVCAFAYYIVRYGWAYTLMSWTRKQSASGLRLSYAIAAMPISGVGFFYFLFEQLVLLFTGRELSEISKKYAAISAKKEAQK